MSSIFNVINEVFNHCEFSKDYFDEFDDDIIPLTNADFKIIKCLAEKPECKWSPKMLHNAVKILNKYEDDIERAIDIDLSNLAMPDIEIDKECDHLSLDDNHLFLPIEFSKYEFEKQKKEKDVIKAPLNYNNIFKLYQLNKKEIIVFSKDTKNKINSYLNDIDIENENITTKNKNPNYNINLLDFQEIGTLFGLINKKIIIADEMGLGKTVQALSITSLADAYPLIIVCPKSVKYKWESECKKINNIETEIYDKKKTDLLNIEKKIYIFTYNDIPRCIDLLETNKNIKGLIFDESHLLKNRKSIRSKSCLRLAKHPDFIIELTGSPLLNRVSEFLNQFDIIKRTDLFGGNIEFLDKYCQRERVYKREDIENFDFEEDNKKLESLANIMKSNFYIRRLKKEVLKSLPDKRRDFLYVDIDNRAEYKKTLSNLKKETDMKRKKQLLSKLKETSSKGKMKAIEEQINDFIESNEKVVVFAYHKKMQEDLKSKFPDALSITSEQSDQERYLNQDLFLKDPNKLVIICSIKVAYAGFDLFSASHMIFAEMDWTPEINKQCEDRIHRIGQQFPVNIWYLIAKDTIEERVFEVNVDKLKITNKFNNENTEFCINQSQESIKNKILENI